MRPFEESLEENYGSIKSSEFKRDFIAYIDRKTTLEDVDVVTAKRVIKIASHILKKDPASIDTQVQKLFDFCIHAIRRVDTHPDKKEKNIATMRAHLPAYAADFACYLAVKENWIGWWQRAYQEMRESADLTLKLNQRDAGYRYGFAGDTAAEVFKRKNEDKWANLAIVNYDLAIQKLKKKDLTYTGRMHLYAGRVYETLWERTKKEVLKNEAKNRYTKVIISIDLKRTKELISPIFDEAVERRAKLK